ncbi:ABC transporter ATP-binding protein [Aminipila butyrica]|uniref:Nickel import system ATP-binding protein NikD n=1 Tax=Aminipila butyrica TaxID=433296 RepID=A0A858BYS2_9FIRM|nr:ABC transporter ATP-binding protein [Aminipila butyrica]QIB69216.1 ABC transporter ATP-binding protein [Aminipila butyrica]
MEKSTILQVKDMKITFSQYTKGLRRKKLTVINGLDLELQKGEILAVVGSSGSGKSLLAHALLGILPDNAALEGEIYYRDQILGQWEKERIRGRELVLIPQSVTYLDPLQKVGEQIGLSVKHKGDRRKTAEQLLLRYGLEPETADCYPFQLSGGMARKVLLATALAAEPEVIIADEPTPGLDEEALGEVLKDFRRLADQGCSLLMITHDIEAALKIADRVAVFYGGTVLETAKTADFAQGGRGLRHPYTRALNQARPGEGFEAISGTQPYGDQLPTGCLFAPRCLKKTAVCEKEKPLLRELRGGKVRCNHAT